MQDGVVYVGADDYRTYAPVVLKPTRGNVEASFIITWASAPPPRRAHVQNPVTGDGAGFSSKQSITVS